jgi:glycerophosphoryl diester phosphodiesterase
MTSVRVCFPLQYRAWEQAVYHLGNKIDVHFKRRRLFKKIMRKTAETRDERRGERKRNVEMRGEELMMRRLMVAEQTVRAVCLQTVASMAKAAVARAKLQTIVDSDEDGDDLFFDFNEEDVDEGDESAPLEDFFAEEALDEGDKSALPQVDTTEFTMEGFDGGDQSAPPPMFTQENDQSAALPLEPIVRGKKLPSKKVRKSMVPIAMLRGSRTYTGRDIQHQSFHPEHQKRPSQKRPSGAGTNTVIGADPDPDALKKIRRSRTTILVRGRNSGIGRPLGIFFVAIISMSDPADPSTEIVDIKVLAKVVKDLFRDKKVSSFGDVKFKIYNCWDGEFPTENQQEMVQAFVLLGNPDKCLKSKKLKEPWELFRSQLRGICYKDEKKIIAVADAGSVVSSFFGMQLACEEESAAKVGDGNEGVVITPIGVKMLAKLVADLPGHKVGANNQKIASYFTSLPIALSSSFVGNSFDIILRTQISRVPVLQQRGNILLSSSLVFSALQNRMAATSFLIEPEKSLESYIMGFLLSNVKTMRTPYETVQPAENIEVFQRAKPAIVAGSDSGGSTNLNAQLPKNSIMLERMKGVVNKGANLIEVDIRMTADGVCICYEGEGLVRGTNIMDVEELHHKFKPSDTDDAMKELVFQDLIKFGTAHATSGDFYISDLTLGEIKTIKKLPPQKFYRDQTKGLGILPQYFSSVKGGGAGTTEELEYEIIPTLAEYFTALQSSVGKSAAIKPGLFLNIVDTTIKGDASRLKKLVASLTQCLSTVKVPVVVSSASEFVLSLLKHGLRSNVHVMYRPGRDSLAEDLLLRVPEILEFADGVCLHKDVLLLQPGRGNTRLSTHGESMCNLLHRLGMQLAISGFQAQPSGLESNPQEQYQSFLRCNAHFFITENSLHARTSIAKHSEVFSTAEKLDVEELKVDARRSPEPGQRKHKNAVSRSGRFKSKSHKQHNHGKDNSVKSLHPFPPQASEQSPAGMIKTNLVYSASPTNPTFKTYNIDDPSDTFMAHMEGPLRRKVYTEGIKRIARRNEDVEDFHRAQKAAKATKISNIKYSCSYSSGNFNEKLVEEKSVHDAALFFGGMLSMPAQTSMPKTSSYASMTSTPANKNQERTQADDGFDLPLLTQISSEAKAFEKSALSKKART